MKVKYMGKSSVSLTNGKIYDVISIENNCYRIVDDTDEDYLFLPDDFEIIEIESATKAISNIEYQY